MHDRSSLSAGSHSSLLKYSTGCDIAWMRCQNSDVGCCFASRAELGSALGKFEKCQEGVFQRTDSRARSAAAWLIAFLAIGSILLTRGAARGDERAASSERAPASIQFRRIFAPADRIDSWPRDAVRYLPIEAQEFAELVRVALANGDPAAAVDSARITAAEYRATLEGDELSGELSWTIASASPTPTLLALPALGLAVEAPHWTNNDQPAVLGADALGQCVLLVTEPGVLRSKWSLRGEVVRGQDSLSFRINLPAAVHSQLMVDAPASSAITADRGLARSIAGAASGWNRVQIDLGAEHHVALRLAAESPAPAAAAAARYRMTESYEIAAHGLTLETRLRVTTPEGPLDRLTLDVDADLRPVAVSANGQMISWSAHPASDGGLARLELQFSEATPHDDLVIDILALGPAPTNQPTLTPLPRIVPRGLLWLEGIATLRAIAPLAVLQLETHDCRPAQRTAIPPPAAGDLLDFQALSERARLAVSLGPAPTKLLIQRGASIEIGSSDMLERVVADVQARQGETFSLHPRIAPQWRIESIEIRDPGNSLEWSESPASGDAWRELSLHFSKPLTSRRPIQLVFVGRRESIVEQRFGMADLEMLQFPNAATGAQLYYLKSADSFEIQLAGHEELNRLSPERLTPEQLQWFFELPSGLLFTADSGTRRLGVTLTPRRPGYSGEIEIDVTADADSLVERCTLRCIPEAARVERVLLHFADADDEPWRFSLAEGTPGEISSRQLSAAESTSLGLVAGVTWEVGLPAPRAVPFELRASRTVPWIEPRRVPLVMMPEAASQRGSVLLRAAGDTELAIQNHGLRVVVPEPGDDAALEAVRGAYRYDPRRDATSTEPRLTVARVSDPQRLPLAWVWECSLDSRFATPESSIHLVTYQIESAGGSRIGLQMPAGAVVRGIWRNGTSLPQAFVDSLDQKFSLELPAGQRFSTVALFFTTQGSLPSHIGDTSPPLPRIDIPILGRHWTVRLPDGYQLFGAGEWQRTASYDLSWSERLFGPLGVPAADDSESRWSLRRIAAALPWRRGVADDETIALQFERALRDKLAAVVQQQDRGATWAQILSAAEAGVQPSGAKLLVDVAALDRMGVSANRALSEEDLANAEAPAHAVLQRAGLTLLVHERTLLVVSISEVFAHSDQLEPLGSGVGFRVIGGDLARRLDAAPGSQGLERFWSTARWSERPERTPPAWNRRPTDSLQWRDSFGWSAHVLDLPTDPTFRVRVVRVAATRSLGWGLFWIVLAVGAWSGRQSVGRWAIACAVGAATALLAPAAVAPLTTPLFLGLAASVMWHLTDWRQLRPAAGMASLSAARFLRGSRALLLIGLALATVGSRWQLRAQDGRDRTRAADSATPRDVAPSAFKDNPAADVGVAVPGPRPHKVFVPVDAAGQPTAGRLQVPEALYRELLRRAGRGANNLSYVFNDAVYRLAANDEGPRDPAFWSTFTATYQLTTFARQTTVALPDLGSKLGDRGPARLVLDGETVVLAPTGERARTFAVAEPGVHQVELRLDGLLPVLHAREDVALTTPRIPSARFEWSRVAENRVQLNALSALGSERMDAAGQLTRIMLGPADKFVVRAAAPTGRLSGDAVLDVQELLWFKVRPNHVVIDALFKFHVVEGLARQVRLSVDPADLHLLPPGEDPTIANVRLAPGSNQIVDIELTRPATDDFELRLSFELRGATGIGRLVAPRLHAVDVRSTTRWAALSVDSTLEAREPAATDDDVLPPKEFLNAWGAAESAPRFARTVRGAEAGDFQAEIWPRAAEASVEQTHAIHCQHDQLAFTVEMTAQIVGAMSSLDLSSSPFIEIDHASLVEAGGERVARWSHDERGVHLFLKAPVTGTQRLRIEGRLPRRDPADWRFPLLEWSGARRQRGAVVITRDADVLVEVRGRAGLEPSDAGETRSDLGTARRTASAWLEAAPQPVLDLAITDNFPQARAIQIDSLTREEEGWAVHVDFRLEVAAGIVDQLRFELPEQFGEPFFPDGPLNHRVVAAGTEGRRQLIVDPRQPARAETRVHFGGVVRTPPGERLRIPDVRPMTAFGVDRYVVLPGEIETQPVVWETLALKRAELPERVAPSSAPLDAFQVYRAQGPSYQATLKSVQRTPASCKIRLADLQYVWQSGGDLFGVASYDLSAASDEQLELRLPTGLRLIHARRNGHPVAAQAGARDQWTLPIGPMPLAQRLELILHGEHADLDRLAGSTPAPELRTLSGKALDQLESPLLTIYSPPQAGRPTSGDAKAFADESHHQFRRVRTLFDNLEVDADVVADQLPEDLARWRRQWRRRYDPLRAELRAEMRQSGFTDVEVTRELRGIDQRIQRLAAPGTKFEPMLDARATLRTLVDGRHVVTRPRGLNERSSASIRFPREFGQRLWSHWGAAALALLLGAACYRYAGAVELPKVHPKIIIASAAAIWVAVLDLPIIGLACLLLLAGGLWLQRRQRPRRLAFGRTG